MVFLPDRIKSLVIIAAILVCSATLQAGIRFDGRQSEVTIPGLRFLGNTPLTVEFVVVPDGQNDFERLLSNTDYSKSGRSGFAIGIREGYWMVSVETELGWKKLISQRPVVIGKRVHLAVVFDEGNVQLYVNGRRDPHQLKQTRRYVPSDVDFLIGSERLFNGRRGFFFRGTLDGFRASKFARYDSSFEPPAEFEADDKTLILYDFQERQGTLCNDKSGFEFHGRLSTATWTPAPNEYVYDTVEELEPFVGMFQVERAIEGGGRLVPEFYELKPDGTIFDGRKQIGSWSGSDSTLQIETTVGRQDTVELKQSKEGDFAGSQPSGGSAINWKLVRIRVEQLWLQNFAGKAQTIPLTLYSNGKLNDFRGEDRWEVNRRKMYFRWGSGKTSELNLSRDGQSYKGTSARGAKVEGARLY